LKKSLRFCKKIQFLTDTNQNLYKIINDAAKLNEKKLNKGIFTEIEQLEA
jgi:hypothetical protein